MSANTVITPQGIPDTEDQHGWLCVHHTKVIKF
jgi:hypothetical protein